MSVKEEVSLPSQRTCSRCKFVSSQEVCKACVLLEGLNKGLPKLGIGKSSKAKRMIEEFNANKINQESLKSAVKDIDDTETKKDVCNSNSKTCNSGLCKSKRKNVIKNVNTNNHVNNEVHCNNKCAENCEKTSVNGVVNPKLDSLLEKYEINESTRTVNANECNIINSNNHDKEDTPASSDDEEKHHTEEDETCSSSCGRLGSLHIGF